MFKIPVLGICAQSSGMGKTTLLERLLPLLAAYGLKVSVIKQTHAEFDVDRPGKDSHRLREAGAAQVLLSSENRWVLMTERKSEVSDYRLMDMIGHLAPDLADLVLVEGFRHAPISKIEVYRPSFGKQLLATQDSHVIAIASDIPLVTSLPLLDLNRPVSVAEFILKWWGSQQGYFVGNGNRSTG